MESLDVLSFRYFCRNYCFDKSLCAIRYFEVSSHVEVETTLCPHRNIKNFKKIKHFCFCFLCSYFFLVYFSYLYCLLSIQISFVLRQYWQKTFFKKKYFRSIIIAWKNLDPNISDSSLYSIFDKTNFRIYETLS